MKLRAFSRGGIWLVATGAFAVMGYAGDSAPLALTPTLDFALGAASELPSPRLLNDIVGSANLVGAQLVVISADETRPPGVRLRALASLAAYPSASVRDAMRSMLDAYATSPALLPIDTWLIRGALEVLATCGNQQDVLRMAFWLERQDLRDVRARAAWALGRLGQPEGIEALRKRFLRETVGQVSYQIAQALEELGE